jgi:hypothetical protein
MSSASPHLLFAPSPSTVRETGARRRPSMRRTATSLVLLGLVGACSWAGSQLVGTGNASVTAPTGPPLPLTARVVGASTLPGMVATHATAVAQTASEWATTVDSSRSPSQETARLRALGFAGGAAEQLHGLYPMAAEAISIAEQYRSATGARAELAYQYSRLEHSPGAKVATFSAGIPGARGVSVTAAGSTGLNVMFAVGRYYYLVGTGSPSSARNVPGRPQLTSAAGVLYLTVNGCVSRGDPRVASSGHRDVRLGR